MGEAMILHLDMDAFFASVEIMDNPRLRGRPVIVAGGGRSVVATASYEARKFGVHSAMPTAQARRLCPGGVFVPPRFSRYSEVSRKVMDALRGFTPVVEQASIDEAYLDAGGLGRSFSGVDGLVCAVRGAIRKATGGLTCSIGAAPVKFLAKICSDINKPDGVCILREEDMPAFLAELPVAKIPGVGRHTREELARFGITKAGDMLRYSSDFFASHFGKSGLVLLDRARGIDPGKVEPCREIRSESAEDTLLTDTRDREILKEMMRNQSEEVAARLRKRRLVGSTATVKIKYDNFKIITRSRTFSCPLASSKGLYEAACAILDSLELERPVRLIGVRLSGFGGVCREGSLLPLITGSPVPEEREKRNVRLERAMDDLRERFGMEIIRRGAPAGKTDGR